MLTVETLMMSITIVIGVCAVFYMGVQAGKNLQYREVQKISKFLGILMERKIFQSESAAEAAYVVSQWFAGKLGDLNNSKPYDVWDEERDTQAEESAYANSSKEMETLVANDRSSLNFDD